MNIFLGSKPNKQHIKALHDLKLQGTESPLVAMMIEALTQARDALMVADDPVRIHRLQGQANALQDFLEAVEKSSEVLERLR